MDIFIVNINRAKSFEANAQYLNNFIVSKGFSSTLFSAKKINLKQFISLLALILDAKSVVSPTPSPLNIFILLFSKILRKKFYVGIHDPEPHEGQKFKRTIIYNYFVTKFSDGIIVFSKFSESILKKKNPRKKIQQLLLLPSRKKNSNNNSKKELKYDFSLVGRLEKYKGIGEFIKIAAELPKSKFLLAGEDLIGINKNELPNNIIFENVYLDFEKYIEYIHNSKALLLPYISATQSGVITDAFHCKTYTISRNVGAIKEQLELFKNGEVFSSFEEGLEICRTISENKYVISNTDHDYAYESLAKERDKLLEEFVIKII